MANHWVKYELHRQINGKINLADEKHEQIIHLLAHDDPRDDIKRMLGVDDAYIDAVLADPLAQKRLHHKRRLIANDARRIKDPKTDAECRLFVRENLVRLSKKAKQDKDRIAALKALDETAREGMVPSNSPPAHDPALTKLAEAFKGKAE